MSQLDQLEQANHAHRQVQGTSGVQHPAGEATGHSGPEEAGHTGPAAEPEEAGHTGPAAEPQVAQGEVQLIHRVQGHTMAIYEPDARMNIVCPGGVFANVSTLMGGNARHVASLALLSTVQPATQLCVLFSCEVQAYIRCCIKCEHIVLACACF